MSLLSVLKDKLTDDGVANSTTWKCFLGYCPDDQDQVISIHLTGGFPQDTHGGENVVQTVQVRVRAGRYDHSRCETQWWKAFLSLHDAALSSDGIRQIQAMATGPIVWTDEKLRFNMTMNLRIVRDAPVLSSDGTVFE